jgi:hypothetical protein
LNAKEDTPGTDSAASRPGAARRDAVLRRRLRLAGAAILLAGLLAAVLVNRTAAPDDEQALEARLNYTKRYEYQMELMGGKANILATEFREWFLGLWHGKRLARTLAVLSVGGGLACFYVAHRLGHSHGRAGTRPGGA